MEVNLFFLIAVCGFATLGVIIFIAKVNSVVSGFIKARRVRSGVSCDIMRDMRELKTETQKLNAEVRELIDILTEGEKI